ncbi:MULTISPECIES: hypothetical protein [unclassified Adlercreutzia]|uniref:hypothetical protein n=1 Tax=unclassified Adlercreutzia TaxID=2636013 RepID=UPI0013ED10BB|nr:MULTISPECIES: hypothetical protein [unclassified Adlercreutzia]
MDYKDTTITYTLHAYMIPPTNLDDIYEEMTGVDWSSLSIDADYYTDTRVSATLTTVDGNYIRGSYIRITVEDEDGNEDELGTFAVDNDSGQRINGAYIQTLDLISQLHALSLDFCPDNLVVGSGARLLDAVRTTLQEGGKSEQDSVLTEANDYRFSSTQVLPPGASRLARLYELCSISGNRLEVDGHGRVRLDKYVSPDSKSPRLRLAQNDERGVIKNGISRQSRWAEIPSKYIVAHDYTTSEDGKTSEHHMFAIANNQAAPARGFVVAKYETVSELSPRTTERLEAIAKQRLTEQANERNEWTISTKYIPGLWEGDVIELELDDELDDYTGIRKCLVRSITIDGPYLDMELVLKETSGGDYGE